MSATPIAGTAPPTGGTMAPPDDPYPFLCKGPGQSCAEDANCCNKTCVAGKCEVKQCGGLAAACETDSDCCDGPCRAGACGDASTMCRTQGSLCAGPEDCCSDACIEGACAAPGTMAACDMALGPCDNFPQCGCGPGEVCHTVDLDTGSRACKPEGTAGAYQPCTDMFGCVSNHVCVGGECKQYCGDDFDCPLTHRLCAPVGRSATESIPGFDVCWQR